MEMAMQTKDERLLAAIGVIQTEPVDRNAEGSLLVDLVAAWLTSRFVEDERNRAAVTLVHGVGAAMEQMAKLDVPEMRGSGGATRH